MHPLDNVIWQALTTRQAVFAQGSGDARRIISEVGALAAVREPNVKGYRALGELVAPGGTARVWLSLVDRFESAPGLELVTAFPGLQMVWENGNVVGSITPAISSLPIEELGPQDAPEMLELATLTKPGPFERRTHELGTYLGIRSEGKLIAMAGERLKVPGYTEVSAVCTHPEHTGKGYARILMLEIMRGIGERGEIPFLHVRQNNARAVELYERMGFRTRMVVQFTVLRRIGSLSDRVIG
jgi:predicted GNAT family acetyltransferase